MAKPRWAHLLLESRTARSWKIPVTVLRGRKDDGVWTDVDRLMALALTAYEASLCPGCGLPHSVTRGDENVGRFEVTEDICHGCEELQAAQNDKSRNSYPGQMIGLKEV